MTDMTASLQGPSLVSTIVTLTQSLGFKVLAEGMETEEQSRLLRLLRCDEMQGFLISKPVPAEIFEAKFLAPALAPVAVKRQEILSHRLGWYASLRSDNRREP